MKAFKNHITINRRYTRSINLDRDLFDPHAAASYRPTPKSLAALRRIVDSLAAGSSARAFTLTAVYGTGKSAFAQFFTNLVCRTGDHSQAHEKALATLYGHSREGRQLANAVNKAVFNHASSENNNPQKNSGLLPAVVVARREPLEKTILRALENLLHEIESLSGPGALKPAQLNALKKRLNETEKQLSKKDAAADLYSLVKEFTAHSPNGICLLIDESGKPLEYSATSAAGNADLYLLQQLAETPQVEGRPLLLITLLHQSFADYGGSLSHAQRAEWAKIQGRFEDIPLQDTPENALALVASAFEQNFKPKKQITELGQRWSRRLSDNAAFKSVGAGLMQNLYPLHPVTARLLPVLSARYAQNERSTFSFLTGHEPFSFTQFLNETAYDPQAPETLKLHQLYDYFIESLGPSLSLQAHYTRWVEIHEIVKDTAGKQPEIQQLVKTVGVLNLVSFSGDLRASKELVILAQLNDPGDTVLYRHYEQILNSLLKGPLLTYRERNDELRLWQGSDINLEDALKKQGTVSETALVEMLNREFTVPPQVAQRHSFKTGTLRYFTRRFIDTASLKDPAAEGELFTAGFDESVFLNDESDGVMLYAISGISADRLHPPEKLSDGRPVVTVLPADSKMLKTTAEEFYKVSKLLKESEELQRDAVARKEARYRQRQLKEELYALSEKLYRPQKKKVFLGTEEVTVEKNEPTGSLLSKICDRIYSARYALKNDLINRREPGSGANKARKVLLEALLNSPGEYAFGLTGNGPEVTIYKTLFEKTGLHVKSAGSYQFKTPHADSGIAPVYREIEDFCRRADTVARPLDELYKLLTAVPYGAREPVLPLLFAAHLMRFDDRLNLYKDGSFLPDPGFEVFELLLKRPEKFSVKYFALEGLRAGFFKEVEKVLLESGAEHGAHQPQKPAQNSPLAVIKPLIRAGARINEYAQKTRRISKEAQRVRGALRSAREPDTLLFKELPEALGMGAIEPDNKNNTETAREMTRRLVQAITDIQRAYSDLLEHCRLLMVEAFRIAEPSGSDGEQLKLAGLRDFLAHRADPMLGRVVEPQMRRIVHVFSDRSQPDDKWLEAVLMIITDKPPKSWRDEDIALFETNLADTARRFNNLDFALTKLRGENKSGFEARMMSSISPSGEELREVVTIPENYNLAQALRERGLSEFVDNIDELLNDRELLNTLAVRLTEAAISGRTEDLKKLLSTEVESKADENGADEPTVIQIKNKKG